MGAALFYAVAFNSVASSPAPGAQPVGDDEIFADSFENPLDLPQVRRFVAEPSVILPGASSTLSWKVDNATTLQIDPVVGPVAATASTLVTPTATAVYTMTATNASGSVTRSIPVTVNVIPAATSAHPRIRLSTDVLSRLRTRAASNDPAWIALRTVCDALAAKPIQSPDGTGGGPNAIGGGYQYFDYLDPTIALGLCYQVAKTVDAVRATAYGNQGRTLLLTITDPLHRGRESTDSGWAIRGIGTAGGNHVIRAIPGTGPHTSSAGALAFRVSVNGTVSATP